MSSTILVSLLVCSFFFFVLFPKVLEDGIMEVMSLFLALLFVGFIAYLNIVFGIN